MKQKNGPTPDEVQEMIEQECDAIRRMLVKKNVAYGNSAFQPVRIFSRASTLEQIYVRIDDKLSRIKRGFAAGEDTIADLIGYLTLLRVYKRMKDKKAATPEPKLHPAAIERAEQESAKPKRKKKPVKKAARAPKSAKRVKAQAA